MRKLIYSAIVVLLAASASACAGGPQNSEEALAAACERQLKEIAEESESGGTPSAKSSEERLENTTISECAGQAIHLEPDATEGDDKERDSKESDSSTPADDAPEEQPADGPTKVELDPAARDAFAQSCGTCHALADAETSGQVGPDLDETSLDADMIEQQIIAGGGAMPAGLLEGEEARSVAEYVAAAAGASQE